jgi:hypothetical protein
MDGFQNCAPSWRFLVGCARATNQTLKVENQIRKSLGLLILMAFRTTRVDRVRFVVFNPTIVVFPLLEIANIVVSTDLDRKRKLFSFTSATMAPRKIIIDTDPVYCPFPVAFDKRSEPTDTFGRGSMTFWRYCWHSQHRQRSFKYCSFP